MQHAASPKLSARSLFISDLHLGARGSRAASILEFLQGVEAQRIYLVGDILDIWHPAAVLWSETHDAIIDWFGAQVAAGREVIYLYGNHDREMRVNFPRPLPALTVAERVTHEAADGRRYLVLHGDQCDMRILRWHLMTRIGSRCDALLRRIDQWLRRRRNLSEGERSLIQIALAGINHLLAMGDGFEGRLRALARAASHDGIICGHSHKPALREEDGVIYANCGDWVDSMTALIEGEDGRLQLLEWSPEAIPASDLREQLA
ncbi:UDP-2,3-diacylglucosamine diphosphatase [Sedimentimonas flavescens]|uniref:UDP-2,3-diacylglucosamine diphosphatase n=1 Tax=Sedimentimonas flavescens TaxID=2851012 RepID=A0ABT2ZXS3_9RHOB|nr:UDP-2,3-diacylglucosamine diphosphatase [Sedimentimonas flavescens]MBW0157313.1 UDP-2,3-diacylglucosamine diphosphatase [Sedimentimonas flavescens]MCV2878551.1 UDP-2,3-diacylglucosamine diphosphatase [Sedimentimonas flavescens]